MLSYVSRTTRSTVAAKSSAAGESLSTCSILSTGNATAFYKPYTTQKGLLWVVELGVLLIASSTMGNKVTQSSTWVWTNARKTWWMLLCILSVCPSV